MSVLHRLTGFGQRGLPALLLLVLVWLLSISQLTVRLDYLLYDLGQNLSDRPIPADVVIVAIDEQSLRALGRWPWSRRIHAQLVDHLHAAGAQVIGLDILFSEPTANDWLADKSLAQAMARSGQVVLPVVLESKRLNGQMVESLPFPPLTSNAAALGRVHTHLDTDNIARSIFLCEGLGEAIWPHFAQAMLATAGQLPANSPQCATSLVEGAVPFAVRSDPRYINFTSTQHQFQTLSYVQVLQGHLLPDTFRGKIVLIGATAPGLADQFPTPVSKFGAPMPGVELIANAMVSMREGTLVKPWSGAWSAVLACILALIRLLWMPYVSVRYALLFNLSFAFAVATVTVGLPLVFHHWIPLSSGLIGILSAYPLYAWQRLEKASQFMDEELRRLRQELKKWPSLTQEKIWNLDPFERRILEIRKATQQLIALEKNQKDTLEFVSHDVRVPLASAAAQIEQALGAEHPSLLQVQRALTWTEEFIQTSRAQMLDQTNFNNFELMMLVHEVADDLYPLLKTKQLRMQIEGPDDPIWVTGHHSSLQRVLHNVVSNAIKFSPSQAIIEMLVQVSENQVTLEVSNPGPGFPPDELTKIFYKFTQIQTPNSSTDNGPRQGVGLGLHYVQTVMHKHGGHVRVVSQTGRTSVTLELPLVYSVSCG
jgi:CHASE2 domain-containing sensor protein